MILYKSQLKLFWLGEIHTKETRSVTPIIIIMSDNFEDNKTRLSENNSAAYNASYFALKARKDEVFSPEACVAYKKYAATLSMLDDRVMWLPANSLTPSFYAPNKIYFKSFLDRHMDCEMPIVMCVSKDSLADMMTRIYDDTKVLQTMADLMSSLEAHTTERFSNDVPERMSDLSGYLEGSTLGDGEVLLIYDTILNLIHKLGNADMVLRYTKETMCHGDITAGSFVRPVSILTGEKKSGERYSPRQPAAAATDPDARVELGLGRVVMREFRHLIRMMFKFGKGDTGSSKDEDTDAQDADFEANLLTLVAKNPPPAGPGALGLVSSYVHLMGCCNTIRRYPRKYELDVSNAAAVWSMLAVSSLDSFSAQNVSYVSCTDKGLRCHMKSGNSLTNLMFTSSRECRTYCALILYLAKRVCEIRCPKTTLASITNRSRQCECCNSGDSCAMAWVCTLKESSDMSNGLTDAKKRSMEGPSNVYFSQMFISEYNDQASVIGSAGTDQQRAGKGYIEAHGKALARLESTLKINRNGTTGSSSSDAVAALGAALIKAADYVNGAEHRVPLMHRGQCRGSKLETVLTDSEGGVSKMTFGLLSVPLNRAKVLTYIQRFASHVNFKLAEFAAKPTQGLNDATSAVASKNIGVYSVRKDQDQVSMKSFYVHPSVNQETEEVFDINTPPKTSSVNVHGVSVKTTSKYKMLNGVMKAADDCQTSFGGGMDFGEVAPSTQLSAAQRSALTSSVTWVLLNEFPAFCSRKVTKSIESLITSVLAQPMSAFNHDELLNRTWKDLLSLFIMGHMMRANNFLIKPNNFYDGITVPKFALLSDAGKVTLEVISQRFLASGPTLVYARTKVESFTTKVSGETAKFVSCSMSKFNPLKQFVGGGNMMCLNNATMTGVYMPLKSEYKGVGGDNGQRETDDLYDEIVSMGEMSKAERCDSVYRNAEAFIAKIRSLNGLDDKDEITFDRVYELFERYSAQVLLEDEDMKNMAGHMANSDYLAAVCERVKKDNKDDEEEEDAIDFNFMITNNNKSILTEDNDNNGGGSTADLSEFADD